MQEQINTWYLVVESDLHPRKFEDLLKEALRNLAPVVAKDILKYLTEGDSTRDCESFQGILKAAFVGQLAFCGDFLSFNYSNLEDELNGTNLKIVSKVPEKVSKCGITFTVALLNPFLILE